jgi:hypothetical protein
VAALASACAFAVPLLTAATTTRRLDDSGVRLLPLPSGVRPGGVAACGGTLFATSLTDGLILAVDLRTGLGRTLLAGVRGRALYGLRVDARTGLLLVTGTQGGSGIVLAVDHRSGVVVRRWDVPDARRLEDLVVTPDAVWVTDSGADRLLRIGRRRNGRLGPEPPSWLVLGVPWPGVGRRAHGIRALPDGRLLLHHSTAGGLWTVSPADGEVRPVPVTGGPRVIAGDRMEAAGDRLWIPGGTSRDGVAELRLDDHHGRLTARWVRDLAHRGLRTPSTVTVSGGRLWAAGAASGPVAPAGRRYRVAGLPLGRRVSPPL